MRQRFFLGAVFCAILIGALMVVLHRKVQPAITQVSTLNALPAESKPNGSIDIAKERSHWEEAIVRDGVIKAYAEFKQAYAESSFSTQHQAAHLWGQLVYEHEGLKGVSICDSSFAFGCYHSLFGTAIAQQGTGVVVDLDKACIDAYGPLGTGCQHGIGHGIMEYFGQNHLLDALISCGKTTQKNPLFGCTSGVFMEYNTPTTISSSGAQTAQRTFDQAHPLAPCNTIVSKPFAASCYYELSQWLVASASSDQTVKTCSMIADSSQKEICFLGMGTALAARASYDVATTTSQCGHVRAAQDKQNCTAGAAWAVYAEPSTRSRAGEVCGALGADSAECASKAKLICTYLPSEEQEPCKKSIEITP